MVIIWAKLALTVALLAIPVELAILYRSKRQDLPRPGVFAFFIAWLACAGLSLVADIFRRIGRPAPLLAPAYPATFVLSLALVLYLPSVIRQLIKLPSRRYAHDLNNRLQAEILRRDVYEHEILQAKAELRRKLAEAHRRVDDLERERADGRWWQSRLQAFEEIHESLDAMQESLEASASAEQLNHRGTETPRR